ncbi:hypothetical protein DPMN_085451 [Dreissena polymorpha]|uniref:Uncharacterized protein n=1 Tax=Dreissena polymorpha TaxID=45954 RepID=A0A9D3YH15_DREPO|nr:hypothetical protein DPMN_085451 [Dreissena polymorpha]
MGPGSIHFSLCTDTVVGWRYRLPDILIILCTSVSVGSQLDVSLGIAILGRRSFGSRCLLPCNLPWQI